MQTMLLAATGLTASSLAASAQLAPPRGTSPAGQPAAAAAQPAAPANLDRLRGMQTTSTTLDLETVPQTDRKADQLRANLANIQMPPDFSIDRYAIVPDARHQAYYNAVQVEVVNVLGRQPRRGAVLKPAKEAGVARPAPRRLRSTMPRILNAAILALGLAGAALPASAQSAMPTSPSPAGISESDRQFMIQDATGGFYEISIAALAQERSSRDDIKAYAAMLIRDHAEYNAALQRLAASKGATLPTGMTADDRTKLNGMSLQSGSTLDRSFILEAVRINNEDRKSAQDEAAATSDPDIRAFLQQFAAVDAKHEQGAKALQK